MNKGLTGAARGLASALVAILLSSPAQATRESMAPAIPNFSPGAKYADDARIFQGIPGIERAPGGRLWATWYAGGAVEGPENYVILTTSGDDGQTWSKPKLVIDPPGDVRTYDPCLWHDPSGRLWLFWAQSSEWWDGRAGVWAMLAEDSSDEHTRWSAPRRLCNGIMLNKPTVLSTGEWLFPVSVWAQKAHKNTKPEQAVDLGPENGANVFLSRDQGESLVLLGQTVAQKRSFDEHMIIERGNGSLWMLIRTNRNIAESFSADRGRTWSVPELSPIPHVNARFFLRRLASGKLLLVTHNPPDAKDRSHLTAWLSADDGKTWHGGLSIDERKGVSYPDGVEDSAGRIRVIYDFERSASKQILMASFTEDDVAKGRPSATTRLRVRVNQATAISPPQPTRPPKPTKRP